MNALRGHRNASAACNPDGGITPRTEGSARGGASVGPVRTPQQLRHWRRARSRRACRQTGSVPQLDRCFQIRFRARSWRRASRSAGYVEANLVMESVPPTTRSSQLPSWLRVLVAPRRVAVSGESLVSSCSSHPRPRRRLATMPVRVRHRAGPGSEIDLWPAWRRRAATSGG